MWGLGTAFVMLLSCLFGDPVKKPAEMMFRAFMIAGAGLCGALFWALFREQPETIVPKQDPEPELERQNPPTIQSARRKLSRTRLGTKRNRDGSVETTFEKIESEEEQKGQ